MKNVQGQWIFGVHPVLEMLRAKPSNIREVLIARGGEKRRDILRLVRSNGVKLVEVNRSRIESIAEGAVHQGVAALMQPQLGENSVELEADPIKLVERTFEVGETPLVVALDRIQDPQNLGAIIRSAHAFGAHTVIMTKDRSADISPVVMKASAGSSAHIALSRVTNLGRTLDLLKERGLWVYGAHAEAGEPEISASIGSSDEQKKMVKDGMFQEGPCMIDKVDLRGPLVLVIGSEGPGIRRLVREKCDKLIEIPMLGKIASINASVATGVLLYEVLRQRRMDAV